MYHIETERLLLRDYRKEDLQDFYEYISNPEVVKFEPYKPMTQEEAEHTLEYRIASGEFIAAELKSTHKMIGNVYLGKRDFSSLEIGYVFNEDYWKKGYAIESCRALIAEASANEVHRIYAECDPDNPASWKLLENLGFLREAHLKQNVFFWKDENSQPIWKDTYIYSLLNC